MTATESAPTATSEPAAAAANLTFRAFEPRDYERLVEISNRIYTDYPDTVEEWRHGDETWEHHRYERLRLVAEDETGQVVGHGQISHMSWQFHPQKYFVHVAVDPPLQGRGYGSTIYARLLEELRQRSAIQVRTNVKESMANTVAWLRRRSFVEVQKMWESRLDVTRFDFEQFAGAEARAASEGITITTLGEEMAHDPEAVRRAYELDTACSLDVPAVDPVTAGTFESFVSHAVNGPNSLLDAFFIAKHGEEYVGLSNMRRSSDLAHVLYQGLTGVRREYRGKGVAMALKLRTVAYARERGKREIRTWNDTRNRPMLRINEAMGFQKQPVWILFQKELG